eukprot:6226019-Amphidinium_carterae.1
MWPSTSCAAAFWPNIRTSYVTSRDRCVTPGRLNWTTRSWPSCSEPSTWVNLRNANGTSCPSRSGTGALASHNSSRRESFIMREPSLPCNHASRGLTLLKESGHPRPKLRWMTLTRSLASPYRPR